MSLSLIITILVSTKVLAVPEIQLTDRLNEEILPFYNNGEEVYYEGAHKKKVHYRKIKRNQKTALIVLPGRTEPTMKYAEVIYDLKNLPVDFFLWDPRGQGASEKLLKDPQKGYVENWEDYITDFHKFYQRELKDYDRVLVLAHSMGAGISLRYSQTYPNNIHGLVLSAPMMEIKTNGVPEFAAQFLMGAYKLIGKKKEYVPGAGPLLAPQTFEENRVTHSLPRFKMAKYIDTLHPNFFMGGATKNWLFEAIQMTKKIKKKKERKKIEHIPLLIFQAGKDEYSKAKRHTKFCENLPLCQLVRFELAKHEMFQETDSIRNIVMEKSMRFIEENL